MARIEKMFEKIMRSPNNTRWRDLVTIIEYYGCTIKSGASHELIFHELRKRPLTISVHSGKVKTIYVKEIIKLIKEIIEEEEM